MKRAILTGLLVMACSPASTEDAATGEMPPLPSFMAKQAKPGVPLIALLTSADACLSCDGGAISRSLRQIRAAYGDRVQFIVFAVGTQTEAVESFVRNERLDAPVVRVSTDEYSRGIGHATLPAVWVVHDGVILNRYHDSPAERWRAINGQVEDFAVTLSKILGPGDAPL